MTRLVLVLAACGVAPVAPPPAAVASSEPAPAPAPRMPPPPKMRAKLEAPHGGSITTLAVTHDGAAAITGDELDELRLWPALDGTREPCVVDLPVPTELAIAPRADGFAVAVIDAAHTLTIAAIDREGRTLSRTPIQAESQVLGLATTDRGFIAWMDDQALVAYDTDGKVLGRLGTEPGQRLDQVVANGRYALAKVFDGKVERLRPIDLTKLAWEKALDAGGPATGPIAISPSGAGIAAVVELVPGTQRLRVFDHGSFVAEAPAARAVGFVGDHLLAISPADNSLAFLPDHAEPKPQVYTAPIVNAAKLATAPGIAVAPAGTELAIARPAGLQYLGYDLEAPEVATAGPDHHLVVGMGNSFALLDDQLAALPGAATPKLPDSTQIADLAWLSGTDYYAEVVRVDGSTALVIANDQAPAPTPDRSTHGRSIHALRYDPVTRLVASALAGPRIERWDPTHRALSQVLELKSPYEQVVPLDPARANGAELVLVQTNQKGTSRVTWTDLSTKKAYGQVAIESFLTADAAGHVYAWTADPHQPGTLALSVMGPGGPIATLAHDGITTLWPDPQGERVLEISAASVTLYKPDGTELWKLALVGASEAVWTGDDAVSLLTSSGIVRIDVATGRPLAARCGWKFGLSPQPHPSTARTSPVCTQLR